MPFLRSCLFLLPALALAQPVAPVRPVEDDYFGTKVSDPYRYLENLRDPEVQAWMKGQAEHAKSVLGSLSGRDALLQRMLQLEASVPAKSGGIFRLANGRIFYRKREASDDAWKLCTRASADAPEVLLVDPNALRATTGKAHALNYFTPSWDGRHVVFGVSQSGSEDASVQIMEVATKRLVDAPITRCQYPQASWLPDGRSFVYTRLQALAPSAPPTEKYQRARVYLHRLGTDPETDQPVAGFEVSPSMPVEPIAGTYVTIDPAGKWMIALVTRLTENEMTLYVAPVAALAARPIAWRQICSVPDEITGWAVRGDDIYLLSHKNAPRFRLLKTSLREPSVAEAEVVLAEQPKAILRNLTVARDALYLELSEGGQSRIWRLGYGARDQATPLTLPLAGGAYVGTSDPRLDGALLQLSAWAAFQRTYVYDPKKRATRRLVLTPAGPYDSPGDLMAEEVQVSSHDGTMVPLSIIRRKDLRRDGSNPTLVIGYGSYGAVTDPFFEHYTYAWLERGGIIAHAHVRGGGENGEAWYRAGQKASKPNTWKDFIACAEYLVREKYTTPARLAGSGTSAGGILIGRAMTERPDLFGAVVPRVGCLNAVRMETTANGVPNIPEFGSCATEAGFQALYEMDALHHVRDGVRYPATLLTHGANDPRVEPWQSGKFAARLQAATASGRPVLFRVDYDSGHGVGATKTQRLQEWADIYSFLFWQFGLKAFQPEPKGWGSRGF